MRGRGPTAVALYVAGREGRLVWRSPELFALLEQERGRPRAPLLAGGVRLGLARVIDRYWGVLVMAAPPGLALAAAAVAAGVSRLSEPTLAGDVVVAALVLTLAAVVWTVGLMAASVVLAVVRGAARRRPTGPKSFASLTWWHWSVPLLHAADPDRVPELRDLLFQRRDRLVSPEVSADHLARGVTGPRPLPGGDPRHRVSSPLVVAHYGVTTAAALDRVIRAAEQSGGSVEVDAVVFLPALRPVTPKEPAPVRGVASVYVLASVLSVVVLALLVADVERDACGSACDGRPASFALAVRWVGQRLLLHDPPGLSPATTPAIVAGLLLSALAVVGVLVLLVAAWHSWRATRIGLREYLDVVERATSRTRVLLVTVTQIEHDTVLAAAARATGAEPRRVFVGLDTVFNLGVVGGVEVVEGQCQQPGPHGPGGATLTPSRLIAETAPDFVIMVGICYGLWDPKYQAIGDILVSRHVQNIDHQKIVDGPDDTLAVLPRGETAVASPILVDRCQSARSTWKGQEVHIGLMLAAATLVDSRTYREELRRRFPEAMGGEMEGHGFAAAAIEAGVPWVVVKAVADLGQDKTYEHQELAATNAASFVLHVIGGGGLDVGDTRIAGRAASPAG